MEEGPFALSTHFPFFGSTIARAVFTIPLEHFQKNRSHAVVGKRERSF